MTHSSLPHRAFNWSQALITAFISWWPNKTAPNIKSSFNSFASDSTIKTASSVPATTISKYESSNCSKVGLRTYSPSINPTLAAPIGPSKGTPEIVNAAEAPIIAAISGFCFLSDDITVQKIWISFVKCSGNMGLMGLSINLEVSVSLSVGLASLLKNPPGILPVE